jgi:hypothetical protein
MKIHKFASREPDKCTILILAGRLFDKIKIKKFASHLLSNSAIKIFAGFPIKTKFKNLSAAYCPKALFEFFAGRQSVKSKIQKFAIISHNFNNIIILNL